jgi:hypothetical protein
MNKDGRAAITMESVIRGFSLSKRANPSGSASEADTKLKMLHRMPISLTHAVRAE